MRIVSRVTVCCVLALPACSDEGTDEAWDPPTGMQSDASSDAASTAPGDTSADVDTTDGGDAPATTTDAADESTGDTTGDTSSDTTGEPPPEELPLPQRFHLPFTCDDAWRLDTWGHAPALDMVREPDQHGTEGAPLLAPASGVVNMSFFHDNAGNIVQIDHGEGWFTTYLHMESRAVEVGAVLVQGDVIGAVGRTGPTSNDHPHLHFELGVDGDGDGEASWGFEGAERVNPWFGGVEYGQANAQTWRDVVSLNCP